MEKELKEIEEITTEEYMDKNDPAYNENNESNENREFYVYEHIRLDNNTCFYVGKGKGERAYYLERNDHHDKISNRHGHAVVIIKNHLTEKEAFELERDTIEDYVFNLGYGIDIDGYRNYSNKTYLTNCTWGGEGTSGLNAFANKTEEEMEIIRRKMSESMKGKNNPMWCKNPFANKTEEEMEIIRRKMSEKAKGNNPYANKTPEEMEITRRKMSEKAKGRKYSEEAKQKINRKVICITTGKIFNSMKDAGNYYKCSNIVPCCKGARKSAGKLSDGTPLKWKYLEDYNNEFKGILINPWNKGKKLFEEREPKLTKGNSRKVICITTGKIFDSLKDAGDYYKCGSIHKCCKGKLKSAGKLNGTPLQWKYLENYNNEFKGILINLITD